MIKANTFVELQASLRVPGPEVLVGLVERWFVGAVRHLWWESPGEPAAGWARRPEPSDIDDLFRQGHTAEFRLHTARHVDYGARSKSFKWSPVSVRAFIARAAEPGMDATLQFHQPGGGEFPERVLVELVRAADAPDWLYFRASFDGLTLRHPNLTRRSLQFLRGFVDLCDPSFGHIAPRFDNSCTALEMLLGKSPDWDIESSRDVLRGYSWVTVCSEELGDRLGGQSALMASGAFTEVAHLAESGYWLQATPTFDEYDHAAAERVFRVVAPVLPAGQPTDPSPWSDSERYKAVIEDASAYRSA